MDAFLRLGKQNDVEPPVPMVKPILTVYTDGACSNNGKSNATAGYGVYFGNNDPRNISKRITGKQTNNVAELTAIIHVFVILEDHITIERKPLLIVSDSEYSIRCCSSYGEKCMKRGWDKCSELPNIELVKQAYSLFSDFSNVSFKHIAAHTGLQDEHSIGNENADRLANEAIGVVSTMSNKTTNAKKYLKVPYDDKEDAKRLGARWDPKRKKWYIPDNCTKQNRALLITQYL